MRCEGAILIHCHCHFLWLLVLYSYQFLMFFHSLPSPEYCLLQEKQLQMQQYKGDLENTRKRTVLNQELVSD